MRRAVLLACLACSPVAAHADDSAILKAKMQSLMDAVAPGDKTPWAAILDKRFVTTDENGEVYNYDQILEQIAGKHPTHIQCRDLIQIPVRFRKFQQPFAPPPDSSDT